MSKPSGIGSLNVYFFVPSSRNRRERLCVYLFLYLLSVQSWGSLTHNRIIEAEVLTETCLCIKIDRRSMFFFTDFDTILARDYYILPLARASLFGDTVRIQQLELK